MEWTFEELLVELCAPTLLGYKPASLFRYKFSKGFQVYDEVQKWNEKLNGFNIYIRILKECCKKDACLIYVYRPKYLSAILSEEEMVAFLEKNGYERHASMEECLDFLSSRLCLDREFPHEIGVFLGYPLMDVVGFIENKGENYMYCGHWKVYGNLKKAVQKFTQYNMCTSYCKERFSHGDTITRLAVAI